MSKRDPGPELQEEKISQVGTLEEGRILADFDSIPAVAPREALATQWVVNTSWRDPCSGYPPLAGRRLCRNGEWSDLPAGVLPDGSRFVDPFQAINGEQIIDWPARRLRAGKGYSTPTVR